MLLRLSGALQRAWGEFWRTVWRGVQAKHALRGRRFSTCTAFMERLMTQRRDR